MATLLGSILVALGLDSGEFRSGLTDAEKSLKKTQKNMERVGANFQKVGAAMTLGVTAPLIAGAAAAVSGFQDQQQAMAQVNASLASMGEVAGRTSVQLSTAADAFEMHSLVDADVILKDVTANLLTYGSVTGSVFDRAQQSIIDLSQKTGKGLLEATTMVGKALNAPAQGLSALTKVGIQFSVAQKASVKSMVETGNIAGAQAIILGELEHQFRGAAQAAADTSPWRQAQVAINQAGDTIGEALLPVIPPIANAIRDAALAFGSLSPQMQQVAIYSLGAAAALGPLIGAVGGIVSITATAIPTLVTLGAGVGVVAAEVGTASAVAAGFGAIIGAAIPFLAAFAGAAALAYAAFEHWDEIKGYIDGVAERAAAAQIKTDDWFKGLNDWANKTDARFGIPSRGELFTSWGDALLEFSSSFSALWAKVNEYDLQRWADGVDAAIAGAFTSAVNSARNLYVGIKTWLQDKLGGVLSWVSDRAKQVGDAFFTLYDRVVGHSYVPDMVDEIGVQMARLQGNMVAPVGKATSAAADAFRKLQQDVAPILDRLFPDQAKINKFREEMRKLGEYAAANKWTSDQTDEAGRRLRNEYMGYSPDYSPDASIKDPTDYALTAAEDLSNQISDKWDLIGEKNQQLGESFAQTTRNIASSLQGLIGSIKSGDWLSALGGLADAFTQLAGGGLFGKQLQSNANAFRGYGGGRAIGGAVLANTDYLVGERGPEILRMGGKSGSIVPNHQLGGPMSIHVAVEEGALFRPVVRSEAGQVSYSMAKTSTRASALRGRQSLS